MGILAQLDPDRALVLPHSMSMEEPVQLQLSSRQQQRVERPDCRIASCARVIRRLSVRRRIPAQVSEIYRDYRSQSGTPDRGSQHHTKWIADSISADQPSDRCAEAGHRVG